MSREGPKDPSRHRTCLTVPVLDLAPARALRRRRRGARVRITDHELAAPDRRWGAVNLNGQPTRLVQGTAGALRRRTPIRTTGGPLRVPLTGLRATRPRRHRAGALQRTTGALGAGRRRTDIGKACSGHGPVGGAGCLYRDGATPVVEAAGAGRRGFRTRIRGAGQPLGVPDVRRRTNRLRLDLATPVGQTTGTGRLWRRALVGSASEPRGMPNAGWRAGRLRRHRAGARLRTAGALRWRLLTRVRAADRGRTLPNARLVHTGCLGPDEALPARDAAGTDRRARWTRRAGRARTLPGTLAGHRGGHRASAVLTASAPRWLWTRVRSADRGITPVRTARRRALRLRQGLADPACGTAGAGRQRLRAGIRRADAGLGPGAWGGAVGRRRH